MSVAVAQEVLRTTVSPCKECQQLLAAQMVVDGDNNVYLERDCTEHGFQRDYYWKNAAWYRRALKLVGDPTGTPAWGPKLSEFPYVRAVCIDLTTRCNLPCPTCFADANRSANWEPSVAEIMARLRGFSKEKPTVHLIGGEPTLRKDLADIIRALVQEGFVPKLITNGIKIAEMAYLKSLYDAGLRWVFLQFDGFRKDTSIAYRSRDIRSYKERAIANMTELNMRVLLACMVEKGFNDDELGDVLNFAANHSHIRQVAFLPASDNGRVSLERDPLGETMMVDVHDRIGEGTRKDVTGEDFFAMLRINRWAYRLTKRADFFPKTCYMYLPLHVDRGRLVPLTRMLNPLNWLRYPRTVWMLARNFYRLHRFETWAGKNGLFVINIEKFRSAHNYDWLDAHTCNKVYLRKEGWALACMHNSYTRNDFRALEKKWAGEGDVAMAFVPLASVRSRADFAPEERLAS